MLIVHKYFVTSAACACLSAARYVNITATSDPSFPGTGVTFTGADVIPDTGKERGVELDRGLLHRLNFNDGLPDAKPNAVSFGAECSTAAKSYGRSAHISTSPFVYCILFGL